MHFLFIPLIIVISKKIISISFSKNKQQYFSFVKTNSTHIYSRRHSQSNSQFQFSSQFGPQFHLQSHSSHLLGNSSNLVKMEYNSNVQFIDIGANLADKMFDGYYMKTQKHNNDLAYVLERAKASNVEKIILTCGSLKEINLSLLICRLYDPECKFLYVTVGIHPTNVLNFIDINKVDEKEELAKKEYELFLKHFPSNCMANETDKVDVNFIQSNPNNFNDRNNSTLPSNNTKDISYDGNNRNKNDNEMKIYGFTYDSKDTELLEKLRALIMKNRKRVVAIGEMGIDFDRLHFAPKYLQIKYFIYQLKLAHLFKFPLFLHMRNCSDVFFDIVDKYKNIFEESGSVIHSFTDDTSIVEKIKTYKNMYIGVNGCSLKTIENLNAVKQIPLPLLLLETDAPWCGIKKTHASYEYVKEKYERRNYTKLKKNTLIECGPNVFFRERNEPFTIGDVAEITYKVKVPNMTFEAFCEQVRANTLTLFRKLR